MAEGEPTPVVEGDTLNLAAAEEWLDEHWTEINPVTETAEPESK